MVWTLMVGIRWSGLQCPAFVNHGCGVNARNLVKLVDCALGSQRYWPRGRQACDAATRAAEREGQLEAGGHALSCP